MAVVGIRQLSRETCRVVKDFEESGEPVILTREGRPIGALMPLSETQLQDLVLATAPEFRPRREEAGGGRPRRTRPLREAAAERGIDLPAGPAAEGTPTGEDAALEELGASVTESELRPLARILSRPLAEEVLKAADTEVRDASCRALAAAGAEAHPERALREMTSATASLYGRLLRRRLPQALSRAEAPEAVLEASRAAGKALRRMNESIIEVPDFSLSSYTAAIRAVEVAWESEVEDEEAVVPERAGPAS